VQLAQNSIPLRSGQARPRWRGEESRLLPFIVESSLGVAAVLLVAALAHWWRWLLPAEIVLFLLIVVATALLGGFWQSAIVSLAAVVGLVLFPEQPLGIGVPPDPAVFLILIALLAVALIVSRLSARVARHAREAELWGGQMHDLYEFTRQTLQMNLHMEPGAQLAELIHEIFALEAVALFDADLHRVYQAGYWTVDPQEMAQNVYYFESADDDPATGIGRRVVRLGSVPVGSLVVRGDTSSLTNNAIASLIAITFDRYRAFANESRMETERRTEQLRATVLDGLAHAYKTPLTAIRAAGTGLVEMGKLSPAQAELVGLINEQTEALNDLTTRLLQTARLDAGEVTVHAEPVSVGTMLEEVLLTLKDRLASMKIVLDLHDDNLVVQCDRQLVKMLLTQYIDNACKYSILGTTITIRVAVTKSEVIFSVHSFGPAIPAADRERIFERYYRSSKSSQGAAGTGIGLSVARRVAQVHGGHVWVTSDEQQGTTFFASIPVRREKGAVDESASK
jgi:two-component system sensor histidine kinase KdpD